MQRQTFFAKQGQVPQNWHVLDADGQVLGRMASRVATILMGKHKPEYTPHIDTGDFVVIVNAEKVVMTGRKAEQKFHQTYSRFPGGLKSTSYGTLREKHPDRLIHLAVKRMLPKGHLGEQMLTKLKVYAGPEHPHAAQQPQPLEV